MMPTMRRIQPVGGPQRYKTYGASAPISTHFRKATCAEVDCPNYLNGWRVRVEGLDPEMLHTARSCGRKFTELSVKEGESYLVFEAGQPCFATSKHRLRLERDFRYLVANGDWRGLSNTRVHTRFEFWQEDFALHQDMVATRLERG
jgi:hypothetical protein